MRSRMGASSRARFRSQIHLNYRKVGPRNEVNRQHQTDPRAEDSFRDISDDEFSISFGGPAGLPATSEPLMTIAGPEGLAERGFGRLASKLGNVKA
jgi:hypothetical protein